MNISRRALLKGTSSIVPVAMLQACASAVLTPASIVTAATNGAQTLATMLPELVSQFPSLIPAATVTQLETYAADAVAAGKQLVASIPAATGATTVQTIDTYINDVLKVLSSAPINGLIPAPFNQVVAALAITVPMLESFINQYLPTAAAVTGATPEGYAALVKMKATAPTVVTQAQAADILATWAKK